MMLFAFLASKASSFSLSSAESASVPTPTPLSLKKWRRVMVRNASGRGLIRSFLRQGLIQIQQRVGDHRPGCAFSDGAGRRRPVGSVRDGRGSFPVCSKALGLSVVGRHEAIDLLTPRLARHAEPEGKRAEGPVRWRGLALT